MPPPLPTLSGNRIQGHEHARQALCHRATHPAVFSTHSFASIDSPAEALLGKKKKKDYVVAAGVFLCSATLNRLFNFFKGDARNKTQGLLSCVLNPIESCMCGGRGPEEYTCICVPRLADNLRMVLWVRFALLLRQGFLLAWKLGES